MKIDLQVTLIRLIVLEYPIRRKSPLKFKYCNFANGKVAKFKTSYRSVFRNISMKAYTIEIQKTKFANI